MGRKNHRTRPTRARWREQKAQVQSKPMAPPIEKMVIPRGRCHFPHRKLQFSHDEAAQALSQARANRLARGGTGHEEKRIYLCEVDDKGCGFWHLTSREQWEKR